MQSCGVGALEYLVVDPEKVSFFDLLHWFGSILGCRFVGVLLFLNSQVQVQGF